MLRTSQKFDRAPQGSENAGCGMSCQLPSKVRTRANVCARGGNVSAWPEGCVQLFLSRRLRKPRPRPLTTQTRMWPNVEMSLAAQIFSGHHSHCQILKWERRSFTCAQLR